MGDELDYDDLDSICLFKSKKYSKPTERNKYGQRICFLLKSAKLFSISNPGLSRTYIREMLEICEKHLIRLSPKVKRKFCRGCYSYLVEGVNSVTNEPLTSPGAAVKDGDQGVKPPSPSLVSVTCLVCTRTRKHDPQS